MKEKTVYGYLVRRATALVLVFWLILMLCLTFAVAEDHRSEMAAFALALDHDMNAKSNHISHSLAYQLDSDASAFSEHPGYYEFNAIGMFDLTEKNSSTFYRYIDRVYSKEIMTAFPLDFFDWYRFHVRQKNGTDVWTTELLPYDYSSRPFVFEGAVVLYNSDFEPYLRSDNRLYRFAYRLAEDDHAAEGFDGFAYINGSREIYKPFIQDGEFLPGMHENEYWLDTEPNIKMCGYFVGNEFFPCSVYGSDGEKSNDFLPESDIPEGAELCTIYTSTLAEHHKERMPLTIDGEDYESLEDYLVINHNIDEKYNYVHGTERGGYGDYREYVEVTMHKRENGQSYLLALYCKPLAFAVKRLALVYVVGLLIALLIIKLYSRRIERVLIEPLKLLPYRAQGAIKTDCSCSLKELDDAVKAIEALRKEFEEKGESEAAKT